MEASVSRPKLVAVDTNVVFHLAEREELTLEAVDLIVRRLDPVSLVLPPTVQQEIGHWAADGTPAQRKVARAAMAAVRSFHIQPAFLLAVGHGITEQIARRLRTAGLLPETEVNDSFVVAEAALLGCAILLTGDEHLRGMDFPRITFELQSFAVAAPVIATPRELVRKFLP